MSTVSRFFPFTYISRLFSISLAQIARPLGPFLSSGGRKTCTGKVYSVRVYQLTVGVGCVQLCCSEMGYVCFMYIKQYSFSTAVDLFVFTQLIIECETVFDLCLINFTSDS